MVGRAHLGFFIKTENLTGLPQVFCGQLPICSDLVIKMLQQLKPSRK